jgi:hypothetical protein
VSPKRRKLLNCEPDLVERTSEHQENGFTFADPRFVEHYINGQFYILVFFRVRDVREEYCAYIQREDPLFGADKEIGRHGGIFSSCSNVISHIKRSQCRSRSQQQPVLVSIVESVESPKGVIPSLVWLESSEKVSSLVLHALYFSSERGLVFFGCRDFIEDKESAFCDVSLRPAVSADKGADQIIESGPEMGSALVT